MFSPILFALVEVAGLFRNTFNTYGNVWTHAYTIEVGVIMICFATVLGAICDITGKNHEPPPLFSFEEVQKTAQSMCDMRNSARHEVVPVALPENRHKWPACTKRQFDKKVESVMQFRDNKWVCLMELYE